MSNLFGDLIRFFDDCSLEVLGILAAACLLLIRACLSEPPRTPVAYGMTGASLVAYFIHQYRMAPDATLQSLWQPLLRCLVFSVMLLSALLVCVILLRMFVDVHLPWMKRMMLGTLQLILALRRKRDTTPEVRTPTVPFPSKQQLLTSRVRRAQDEYEDAMGILNSVSSLDSDEAEEIEMLAKQRLLGQLGNLLGADDEES